MSTWDDLNLELDCYQTLVLQQMAKQDLNIDYLGSQWPWQLNIETGENAFEVHDADLEVELIEAVNPTLLKKFYGVKLIREEFESCEDLYNEVLEKLRRYKSLMVGVDQFYIPYHYKHIYGKEHGLHTLLLKSVNYNLQKVECESAIPNFSGYIDLSLFERAMKSEHKSYWCSILLFDGYYQPNEYEVFDIFTKSIKTLLENRRNESHLKQTPEYISFLKKIALQCDEEIVSCIKNISKSNWGWNLPNQSKLFKKYVKMCSAKGFLGYSNELFENIEKIDYEWQVAYQVMFKGIFRKPKDALEKSIERLEKVSILEETSMSMLCEKI